MIRTMIMIIMRTLFCYCAYIMICCDGMMRSGSAIETMKCKAIYFI